MTDDQLRIVCLQKQVNNLKNQLVIQRKQGAITELNRLMGALEDWLTDEKSSAGIEADWVFKWLDKRITELEEKGE